MPDAPPDLTLTHHAIQRGAERMHGIKPETLLRMARYAMTKGMPMAETRGDLLRYIQERMRKHQGKGNQTCIRDGYIYIIHNRVLITVLFLRDSDRDQVRRWLARNPPKAKSSGSLKDPHSGAMTPENARGVQKRVSNALKSPVSGGPQPGGAV